MNIKTLLISTAFLTSLISSHSYAARNENQQALVEGTTFTTSVIAGTVAAGPVGFVIGALGGSYLAKQTRKANEGELALVKADEEKSDLEAHIETQTKIAKAHADKVDQLEESLMTAMTFHILFPFGGDALSDLDKKRVDHLAAFLLNRPNLAVSLNGYADNRGTDEYNNVLSFERAKSVQTALIDNGIDAERIWVVGHGASQSTAQKGDFKGLQKERRVDIEVMTVETLVQIKTDNQPGVSEHPLTQETRLETNLKTSLKAKPTSDSESIEAAPLEEVSQFKPELGAL